MKTTEKQKSLCLIRDDNIGDFFLWLPTAKYYRQCFPEYKITLIVNEKLKSLANILTYWNEFTYISSEHASANQFAEKRFNILLNTQYSRTYKLDCFIKSLRADKKLAVDALSPNMSFDELKKANSFYSKLIKTDSIFKHELERNFEILNTFAQKNYNPSFDDLPDLNIPPFNLPANAKQYIAIFPGASYKKRAYPWPRFVDLIKAIHAIFPKISVILCGGSDEYLITENILQNSKMQNGAEIFNLSGQTTILESLYIISKAILVISNDSAAAHMATILNKELICLVGGGYTQKNNGIGRFFPYPDSALKKKESQTVLNFVLDCYNCNNHCKYELLARDCFPCIDYISIHDLKSMAINKLRNVET